MAWWPGLRSWKSRACLTPQFPALPSAVEQGLKSQGVLMGLVLAGLVLVSLVIHNVEFGVERDRLGQLEVRSWLLCGGPFSHMALGSADKQRSDKDTDSHQVCSPGPSECASSDGSSSQTPPPRPSVCCQLRPGHLGVVWDVMFIPDQSPGQRGQCEAERTWIHRLVASISWDGITGSFDFLSIIFCIVKTSA